MHLKFSQQLKSCSLNPYLDHCDRLFENRGSLTYWWDQVGRLGSVGSQDILPITLMWELVIPHISHLCHISNLVFGRFWHPSPGLDECGVHGASAVVKGGEVHSVSQQLDQFRFASNLVITSS